MKDAQIRAAVKNDLLSPYLHDPDTRIIDELGLKHGYARVDIAVVNGELHGYEIKSDRDTLKRLPLQRTVYDSVLDRITLVLAPYHLSKGLAIVPDWWGINVADEDTNCKIQLSCLRHASKNPSVCPLSVAKLLWRDEALRLLVQAGAAKGMHTQPRKKIYARLIETLSVDDLRCAVRHELKSRPNWRSDGQQKPCDG
jgi:hypothetical protein